MAPDLAPAQVARLALLEGALLSILRAAHEDGFDGLTVDATVDEGVCSIDLAYTRNGQPMGGHSL